ncbi:tyrosine-type recombinase/integrase [Pseudoalteromonas rubra]|uniref:tyrosine-type recombinase/integrase n=1 Tax=Pseudoalteromonas rubra TaxID=43658 RepID=UPI002DBBA399|nr:tyrosine-type recombinase/integrase [Pseudoalteromonas rubra]MEC4090927.1 tyrosine-type recombinase/integrase [Pseudoalteromonas rubra]
MANKINAQQLKSLIKTGKVGYHSIGNGLYIRISKERSAFWVVRYTIHKKRREITFGKYPDVSLAEARLKSAQIVLDVKNENIDPQAEKKRIDNETLKTVNDLAEDWLQECEKRLKHPNIPRRIYTKDLAPYFGELAIDKVNPRDIRGAIQRITQSDRPSIANDALMYCKQLFRHAIKLDLRTSNPAEAFNVSDAGGVEQSRSRALSLEELEKVYQCLRDNSDQFTRDNYLAFSLLLCLGVRKGELIAAKWAEFDFKEALWHIPQERSKTGRGITVPLSPIVIEWLKELQIRAFGSDYVFPNRRASKRFGHISPDTLNAAIQKLFREDKMPVPHFTVHDLRRTCRSLLASNGVAGHIAERCLNHKLKGVEGIYDRYDYLDERRAALAKITALILSLMPSN